MRRTTRLLLVALLLPVLAYSIAAAWRASGVFFDDGEDLQAKFDAGDLGGGGGHAIQEDGTPTAVQPALNFLPPLTATDNPGNSSTDIDAVSCNIPDPTAGSGLLESDGVDYQIAANPITAAHFATASGDEKIICADTGGGGNWSECDFADIAPGALATSAADLNINNNTDNTVITTGSTFYQPVGTFSLESHSDADWTQTAASGEICYGAGLPTRRFRVSYASTVQRVVGSPNSTIAVGLGAKGSTGVAHGDLIASTVKSAILGNNSEPLTISSGAIVVGAASTCLAPLVTSTTSLDELEVSEYQFVINSIDTVAYVPIVTGGTDLYADAHAFGTFSADYGTVGWYDADGNAAIGAFQIRDAPPSQLTVTLYDPNATGSCDAAVTEEVASGFPPVSGGNTDIKTLDTNAATGAICASTSGSHTRQFSQMLGGGDDCTGSGTCPNPRHTWSFGWYQWGDTPGGANQPLGPHHSGGFSAGWTGPYAAGSTFPSFIREVWRTSLLSNTPTAERVYANDIMHFSSAFDPDGTGTRWDGSSHYGVSAIDRCYTWNQDGGAVRSWCDMEPFVVTANTTDSAADGAVSSSTATTITVSPSPGWTVDAYAAEVLTVLPDVPYETDGSGRQFRIITSNTADTITIQGGNWQTNPSASDAWEINPLEGVEDATNAYGILRQSSPPANARVGDWIFGAGYDETQNLSDMCSHLQFTGDGAVAHGTGWTNTLCP